MIKKKAIAIVIIIVIIIGVVVGLSFILIPFGREYIGQRKALICASANDFYGSEPEDEFNDGNDSKLDDIGKGPGNWTYNDIFNSYGEYSSDNLSLSILSAAGGITIGNYYLNFSDHYTLYNYVFYNMTANIFIQNPAVHPIGEGVQIGLIWLDSAHNVVREDWSINVNSRFNEWFTLNVTGVCNNGTENEITDLTLALKVNISDFIPINDIVYFDNIEIYKWVLVDLEDPTPQDPPPPPFPGLNSDGFPAQALQVYWILKNHGYTDDNIFLMLYYKDDADGIIDISIFDAFANDLNHTGELAIIDVANDSVTAARFKQELDVSYPGSFASDIHPEDYLIIFMCDHGSNAIPTQTPNATFHFEADNSFITELEFYNLVKQIECQRMMINVDCCFSGNFLNQNIVGNSWYDIENCITVTASSNLLAWYYINNKNPDGFAGSWFFHWFWDVLDHDGSILDAYNFAFNWPPAVRPMPLFIIQNPMIHDNMGINATLSFTSDPPL